MKQRILCFEPSTPEIRKLAVFVLRAVFNDDARTARRTFDLLVGQYMAMFAYKVLVDMQVSSDQAVSILRFFRDDFMAWEEGTPFILSLNDGKYAVVITCPESRRLYDYVDDVDRSHPAAAIPLPVPVVQASVNLSRAIELELDIR